MAQVKIKVRPKQSVQFPGICVHCGRPAPQAMTIRKRLGRVTRLIDVPVCPDCTAQLRRHSMEEERLNQLKYLVGGAAFLVTLFAVFIVLPPGLATAVRLLAGVAMGGVVTAVIFAIFRRQIRQVYLPEKKAILQSARIENFSWRATTFAFENEEFAQRFVALNESHLMEI
ncbi:MAG: hypothetical protein HND44_24225 [Chloroflexi bacterium]|nr:hypothetical protein [Ardenticatenaceae bacterium]MBL1131534.1 hypothetical protein [Chloroflexota bacterium]NOG37645.1 hypothetical protein [Chloroflexota bacterium]